MPILNSEIFPGITWIHSISFKKKAAHPHHFLKKCLRNILLIFLALFVGLRFLVAEDLFLTYSVDVYSIYIVLILFSGERKVTVQTAVNGKVRKGQENERLEKIWQKGKINL